MPKDSEDKDDDSAKGFNFNSFLVLVLMAGGALISTLGFMQLSDIKDSIKATRLELMPRHEIELQISAIRESQSHCEAKILEVQAKMISLELDLARNGVVKRP